MTVLPVPADNRQLAPLDVRVAIPEEEIWLASQKSPRTRWAYRLDVQHFMRPLGIETQVQFRQIDHRAVIAWERMQQEQDGAAPSTIRRRCGRRLSGPYLKTGAVRRRAEGGRAS